jgi:hypothetical protein
LTAGLFIWSELLVIRINVSSNTEAVIAQMNARRDQVPFATALALTRTAAVVKDAEVREMRDVFDRPTPYTLNALYMKPATKSNLQAVVWLKADTSKGTPADKYLTPQIRGGARSLKRFERALAAVGALPPDYMALPGAAAKLDSYGNMDRGQIVQLLSYFKAFPEMGYRANITDARKAKLARGTKSRLGFVYFVGRPAGGKLPLGIWQRFNFGHGSAIKPIMIFVPSVLYNAVFDFDYVAKNTIAREFPVQFRQALIEAQASAR